MITLRPRFLGVFLLVLFSGGPVAALDPMQADILTLRLGMTEAEIIGRLQKQGWRIVRPTDDMVADGRPMPVQARTKDGSLRVEFERSGRAGRVIYRLTGQGPNEAAAVRDSVIDRFGTPTIEAPLSWCGSLRPDNTCPEEAPRLIFQPGGSTSGLAGILSLTAGPAR